MPDSWSLSNIDLAVKLIANLATLSFRLVYRSSFNKKNFCHKRGQNASEHTGTNGTEELWFCKINAYARKISME